LDYRLPYRKPTIPSATNYQRHIGRRDASSYRPEVPRNGGSILICDKQRHNQLKPTGADHAQSLAGQQAAAAEMQSGRELQA